MLCDVCVQSIVAETDRVYCFGGCNKILHVRCSDLTRAGANALKDNVGLKYMCFDCRKAQICLNKLQQKCSELVEKFDARNCKFNDLTSNVESGIKTQLQAFENSISRIESTIHHQLLNSNSFLSAANINCISDEDQEKESYAAVCRNNINTKRKKSTSEKPTDSNSAQTQHEIGGTLRSGKRRLPVPRIVVQSDAASCASTSHSNPPISPLVKTKRIERFEKTVLLRPKCSQQYEVTKSDMCDKLDPIAFAVKEVHFRDSGEVTIQCDSKEHASKLVSAATDALSDKYTVEVMKPLNPRVKLIGLTSKFDESVLIQKIKTQNNLPSTFKAWLIRIAEPQNKNLNKFNVVLELDAPSFDAIMKLQRVYIGWERCRVVENINVKRCYNCSEYGHLASSCEKPVCCPRCAECHEISECVSDFVKCVNCDKMNSLRTAKSDHLADIHHSSWSQKCPIYIKRFNKARQNIDYSI